MVSYQWDLYDWTVQHSSDEPNAELDDVIEASASGGSSELTIPALGRLSEREVTWFFNVTATNWLGGVGWNEFEVGGWMAPKPSCRLEAMRAWTSLCGSALRLKQNGSHSAGSIACNTWYTAVREVFFSCTTGLS